MRADLANQVLENSISLFDFLNKLSQLVSESFAALGPLANALSGNSNSKGDECLVGDIECEKSVISYFERSRIPCLIASEEHGLVDLTNGRPSRCTVVVDGLDGSKYAQENLTSHSYGTAVGILKGSSPTLLDAVGTLFVKHGEQLSQIFVHNGNTCKESGWTSYHARKETLSIAIDSPVESLLPDHFRQLKKYFPDNWSSPSAQAFADIYQGKSDAFVRLLAHGNLELAAFSSALNHIGASVRTLSGIDFMCQPYSPSLDTKELVVIGRSPEVTDSILGRLLEVQG